MKRREREEEREKRKSSLFDPNFTTRDAFLADGQSNRLSDI
jgi:hypothetical protein